LDIRLRSRNKGCDVCYAEGADVEPAWRLTNGDWDRRIRAALGSTPAADAALETLSTALANGAEEAA